MAAILFVEDLKGNPLDRSRIRSNSPFTARLTRATVSGAQKGGLTTKLGKLIDLMMEDARVIAQTVATETAQEPKANRKALYQNYFQSRSGTRFRGFVSEAQLKAYWATDQFRNRRKVGKSSRAGWKVLYTRKRLEGELSLVNNEPQTRFVFGGFAMATNRQQPFHRAVGVRSATIIRDRSFGAALEYLRKVAPVALADLAVFSFAEAVLE